jgi:signal peptidase I
MNKAVLKEIVETVVFVIVAIIIIRFYLGEIRWIPSASMKPTLVEGDRVFVERFTRFFKTPSRGDIMVFYPPQEDLKANPIAVFSRLTGFFCKDIAYIKRVIALPNEKIEIKQNPDGSTDILVNDKILDEPYIMDKYDYTICTPDMNCGPLVLGENEYFMMGDNRGHSADSRYWGVLTKDRFIGKAKLLFWPVNHFHYFEKRKY